MQKIIYNPFRVIGILANSSSREILSRKGKITAYAKVGKEITSEFDFPFFTPLHRDNTTIERAFSDIEQNQDKVNYSLFWLVNHNQIDKTAFEHLFNGNLEKAIEIWEKLTNEKEINSKNFSAFNNIGTLYLLGKSKEEIKKGISAKIKLIESENFIDFVHSVADETFSIDKNKQIEIFVDEVFIEFKDNFTIAEKLSLFSECSEATRKYISQKLTREPIHKIETQIEQSKNKRSQDKINANRFGVNLYNKTKGELSLLKSILGTNSLQYKMLADNVAKELLQCSIDYFNESQEHETSNDYHDEAMKLAKLADSITLNKITKDRIKDNINTLEEMKDRELNQAIDVLKMVMSSYESNKLKITAQVMEMPLGYNQSINWSKVNRMIEESLDWDKVVELVKEIIPLRNVEKIKNSQNQKGILEFKNLVDFLFGKLNYYQKNQLKYLSYWKSIDTSHPSPQKNTTFTPSQGSASNEGCAPWVYWVVGILILFFLMKTCS